MNNTNTSSTSSFEATVLSEFGKVGTAIRKSSEATNSRINKLDEDLSVRMTGLELRLERSNAKTISNGKQLNALEKKFEKHRDDEISQLFETASGEEEGETQEPRRGPFSISITDLVGFLKILPLVVALGAGVAGVVLQSCNETPSKAITHPAKVDVESDGTNKAKQTDGASPQGLGQTSGK